MEVGDSSGINRMRAFFASGSRECTLAEFTAFWKSLKSEEKTEFREAAQRWDGKSEFIPPAPVMVHEPLALPPAVLAQA